MRLRTIVYVSTAVRPFSSSDLFALLAQSGERNQQVGITGMLLHKSGCFLQALEGDEVEVRKVYQRIERDTRHRNIVVLLNEPIEHREFTEFVEPALATRSQEP